MIDEFPAEPEIVDIALRDALDNAEHPRVRELLCEALQIRFALLDGGDELETIRSEDPPRLEAWVNGRTMRYEERTRAGAWIEADADSIEEPQP